MRIHLYILENMLKNATIKVLFFAPWLALLLFSTACNQDPTTIRIAATTDVHGMIFPRDLIAREASDHSLAHIYDYVLEQRERKDTLFFLLDNGDFLQGQPTVYYYNFVGHP
jgi:2',3'-cyclic-nucleotide 2'-phosphodiesterase/3'-nucleotidase